MAFLPTYIEVLASLLIFGVTLPSILIRPRLQVLHDESSPSFRVGRLTVPATGALSTRKVISVIVLSIFILVLYLIPMPDIVCGLPYIEFICVVRDVLVAFGTVITSAILLLNIVLVVYYYVRLRAYDKTTLLNNLRAKAETLRNSDTSLPIGEQVLTNIGDLGQICEAGAEKEAVLLLLDNLVDTLAFNLTLSVFLARNVRRVIVGGDAANTTYALKILKKIYDPIINYPHSGRIVTIASAGVDPTHAGEVLNKSEDGSNRDIEQYEIFTLVLKELEEVVSQGFSFRDKELEVEILHSIRLISKHPPPLYASAFLNLGKVALANNSDRSAIAIFSNLHTLTNRIIYPTNNGIKRNKNNLTPSQCEVLNGFFGLMSCLWLQSVSIRPVLIDFSKDFDQSEADDYIKQSIQFFQQSGDFDTATNLRTMLHQKNQLLYLLEILQEVDAMSDSDREQVAYHFGTLDALRSASPMSICACGVTENTANVVLKSVAQAQLRENTGRHVVSNIVGSFWDSLLSFFDLGNISR